MEILLTLLLDPAVWVALTTLTLLEVVLGIDNVVFIAVMAARAGPARERLARTIGIFMALAGRVLLVSLIFLMPLLEAPLFPIPAWVPGVAQDAAHRAYFSYKSLIFLVGGFFLLYKAVEEIHAKLEGAHHDGGGAIKDLGAVLVQIFVLNLVFSVDSILTALGMVEGTVDAGVNSEDGGLSQAVANAAEVTIMLVALLISTIVMLVSAGPITRFMQRHPAVKILAFAFLLLIGFVLVLESIHIEINKALIYAALGFAIAVEALQIFVLARTSNSAPVTLKQNPPRGARH